MDDVDEGGSDELKGEALKVGEVDNVDGRSFDVLSEEAPGALLAKTPMVVNGDGCPCKVKFDVLLSQLHGKQQYVLLSHCIISLPPRSVR